MAIAELIKSLAESSRDRIKTPITGSFMLTFILYNWRPLALLMFSQKSIEEKIVQINLEYSNILNLLIPMIIAAIYVVGVPYIMMVLEKASGYALISRKRHKNIHKVEDLKLLADVLRLELDNERIRSGKQDIKDLNDKVDELKLELSARNEEYDVLARNYQDYHKQSSDELVGKTTLITDLNKRLAAFESQTNVLLQYSGLQDAIKSMSQKSLAKFMNLSTDIRTKKFDAKNFTIDDVNEFSSLKLIKINDEDIEITATGNRLIGYINATASIVFEPQN